MADVHELLGTAADARLAQLLDHIVHHQPAGALSELDAALLEGVDVGQLLEQLLGYLRDCMVLAVGGSADNLAVAAPDRAEQLAEASRQLGLETLLAMLQMVEHVLNRLRYSTQGRILAEILLVRLCSLERLDELREVVEQIRAGAGSVGASPGPPAMARLVAPKASPHPNPLPEGEGARKHASAPATSEARPAGPIDNLEDAWRGALGQVSEMLASSASKHASLAIAAPDRLVVAFPPNYNFQKAFCEQPERLAELEKAVSHLAGRSVHIELRLLDEPQHAAPAEAPRAAPRQRAAKLEHPLVRRAIELFDAQPIRVEEPGP
jgi:DNA polymerase-3 subunit gamma/tau